MGELANGAERVRYLSQIPGNVDECDIRSFFRESDGTSTAEPLAAPVTTMLLPLRRTGYPFTLLMSSAPEPCAAVRPHRSPYPKSRRHFA